MSSSFSRNYSILHKQQEILSKDKENLDVNMDRSRRMQAETSKRRRAQAVKRRQETDREERRRQEILARRREDIRLATEKYQRLNKHYKPKTDAEIRQQLLHQPHPPTPGLEDALRAVRGSSHFRPKSAVYRQKMTSSPQRRAHPQHPIHGPMRGNHALMEQQQGGSPYINQLLSVNSFRRSQSAPTQTNHVAHNHSKPDRHHDMQSKSHVNAKASRTLFEQHLELQQHQLQQQRQEVLDHFSAVVRNEMSAASAASADSLEQEKHARTKHSGATPAATATVPMTTVSYATSAGSTVTFSSHRPTNSPVAVVTPSIIRRSASEPYMTLPPRASTASTTVSDGTVASKPYNKNNYDAAAAVAHESYTNDSIDATAVEGSSKPNAEKSQALLDVLADDEHATAQDMRPSHAQNEVVVQTVGIEGHFASATPHASRHHRNAWTAPDDNEVKDIGSKTQANLYQIPQQENRFGSVQTANSRAHTNTVSGYYIGAVNSENNSNASRQNGEFGKVTGVHSLPPQQQQQQQDSLAMNYLASKSLIPDRQSTTTTATHIPHSFINGSTVPRTAEYNANLYANTTTTQTVGGAPQSEQPSTLARPSSGIRQPSSIPNYFISGSTLTSQSGADKSNLASAYGSYAPVKATPVIGVSSATPTSSSHHISIPQPDLKRGAPAAASAARKYDNLSTIIDPSAIDENGPHYPRPKNPVMDERQSVEAVAREESDEQEAEVEEKNESQHNATLAHAREKIHKNKKGILKKTGSAVFTNPRVTDTIGVRGYSSAKGLAHPQRVQSAQPHLAIRDSVDLAKEQLSDRSAKRPKLPRKKSVRFWDMPYEDTMIHNSDGEEVLPDFTPLRTDDPNSILKRPHQRSQIPKPIHTQATYTVPASSSSTQNKSSPAKRGPFLRPHPPPNPPSGRAAIQGNSYANRQIQMLHQHQQQQQQLQQHLLQQQRIELQQHQAAIAAQTEAGEPEAAVEYDVTPERHNTATAAVYDANGVRLDHTPTDDEINWLWDKVRTCLNRDGARNGATESTQASVSHQQSPTPVQSYRLQQANTNVLNTNNTHAVNTKYMDGSAVTSQLRTTTTRPVSASSAATNGASSGYGQPHAPIPRAASGPTKKVSMDSLGAYNRRQASLLSQRKREQGSISYHNSNHLKGDSANGSGVVLQTSVHHFNGSSAQQGALITDQQQVPDAGNMTSTGPGIYPPANVTESLAAFVTAERLVDQNEAVNEAAVEQAMLDAQARQASINAKINARGNGQIPSAISIEEQRLLQSLERLNERLKSHGKPNKPRSSACVNSKALSPPYVSPSNSASKHRQSGYSKSASKKSRATTRKAVRLLTAFLADYPPYPESRAIYK